jgi:hypothetical protein
LSSRVKNSAALALIGVVQVKLAAVRVVSHAWIVIVGFGEADLAVGGEADFAAGWRGNESNVAELVAERAGDRNAANWLHFAQCFHQAVALALFKRIDAGLPVLLCGKLVDGHLNADVFTHLGTGAHRSGVNRFVLPIVRGERRYGCWHEDPE